jgi:hypothetical protein
MEKKEEKKHQKRSRSARGKLHYLGIGADPAFFRWFCSDGKVGFETDLQRRPSFGGDFLWGDSERRWMQVIYPRKRNLPKVWPDRRIEER